MRTTRSLLAAALLPAALAAPCTAQSVYGDATPGSAGIAPEIWLRSSAFPGNSALTIRLDRALGGAPAVVAFGLQRARIPLLGVDLLVQSLFAADLGPVQGPGGQPGTGWFDLNLAVPNDPNLPGLRFCFQYLVLDPGAAQGLAATAGLEVPVVRPPLIVACGSAGTLDPVIAYDPLLGTVTDWNTVLGVNNPTDVQFTPDGSLAVVASALGRQFVIADATNGGARLAAVTTPGTPNSAAITPDGRRAYAITGGTQGSQVAAIHVLDLDPASPTFGRELGQVAGLPAGVDQLEGCEVSTDGRVLTASNLGLGQTPYLFVIDIAAGSPTRDRVVHTLQLPAYCTDAVPSPDGRLAYAALAPLTGPGSVMVFDTTTGLPTAVVPNVGRFPTDIDLDPLGRFAYLACGVSGEVVRVDLRTDTGTFGATLATPGLSQPFALALASDGATLWTTQQNGTDIVQIDAYSMQILGRQAVGPAAYAAIDVR